MLVKNNDDKEAMLQGKRNHIHQSIFYFLPGNIYWKDLEGRYLGCNLNVAKLLKLSSPSDIIGKTDYDLMDNALAEKTIAMDKQVIQTNKEMILEEEGFDLNHHPAIYLSTKRPLHDEAGNVIGLLGISQDITKRKNMGKASAEAKVLNHAKSQFIQNISHDIRTPFVGILGITEILKQRLNNPADKQLLNYIHEASQQLLNLLNEIINIIPIENRLSYEITMFNLEEVINDTIKLMEPSAKAKKLELKIIKSAPLPMYIVSDKMRIHRIMINLLSNALKFTQKGKIELIIDFGYKKQKPTLTLQVKDTGIGIPEDKFEEIFDRFTRLTPSYEGVYSGIGLGLYLVKQFVKDLGGTIEVQSKLGQGSTFTCQIPLETVNAYQV